MTKEIREGVRLTDKERVVTNTNLRAKYERMLNDAAELRKLQEVEREFWYTKLETLRRAQIKPKYRILGDRCPVCNNKLKSSYEHKGTGFEYYWCTNANCPYEYARKIAYELC